MEVFNVQTTQPSCYSLYKGTEFNLKGLQGYSVVFKTDAAGIVTEAVFHQPNGTFTAKKK
jgi:hypothetical protein